MGEKLVFGFVALPGAVAALAVAVWLATGAWDTYRCWQDGTFAACAVSSAGLWSAQ